MRYKTLLTGLSPTGGGLAKSGRELACRRKSAISRQGTRHQDEGVLTYQGTRQRK
jgi:hypothetical protein